MLRLEAASKTVAGEESIHLIGADRKVGFSLKEPKAEKLILAAPVDHIDESDAPFEEREPTAEDLARIAKNHPDPE